MSFSTVASAPEKAWEFGGYPYALMPLVLPPPELRRHNGDLGAVERESRLLHSDDDLAEAIGPESDEQLFWFRWIIGNQAVTALWQLLDDELALVLSDGLTSAARNAADLLDGYSALLIYAGTPTRELYRRLIRPAMALQHRSFSGRWAQDYVPVMAKLQALRTDYRGRPCPEAVDRLIAASRRNHRTHVAVAAKLVPDDDSLLRSHDGLALGAPTEETVRLYDAFYSTVRELVARESVAAQLLHRLRAVRWDVRVNGLYPAGVSSADERPARLWDDDIAALEHGFTDVLRRAGAAAVAALRRGPATG